MLTGNDGFQPGLQAPQNYPPAWTRVLVL